MKVIYGKPNTFLDKMKQPINIYRLRFLIQSTRHRFIFRFSNQSEKVSWSPYSQFFHIEQMLVCVKRPNREKSLNHIWCYDHL